MDDPDALARLFAGTVLEGRAVQAIDSGDGGTRFLAVEIAESELVPAWRAAHSLLVETHRWPVMGNPYPQPARLQVAAALAATRTADAQPAVAQRREAGRAQLRAMQQARSDAWGDKADDGRLQYELVLTRSIYGLAPDVSDVRQHVHPSDAAETLDRWLMEWEESQADQPPARTGDHLRWFWDGDLLVFLPAQSGAEVLVYLDFWGEQDAPGATPAGLAAIIDYWQAEYDAQLITNWGTMLQFLVDRPPRTLEQAWQLAIEQNLVAGDTLALPDVSLREHARALVDRPTWFLHSRP